MQKINTILLVDDDAITNFLNERIILKLNIAKNVKVMIDGNEGLSYLINNYQPQNPSHPDIVLLDINMPVMNGFEFIKALYRYPNIKKIKIIFLTTSRNIQDMEKIKSLGNFKLLNKPLTKEKFLSCLSKKEKKNCELI
jgi:CheY-like chemotaxis protein